MVRMTSHLFWLWVFCGSWTDRELDSSYGLELTSRCVAYPQRADEAGRADKASTLQIVLAGFTEVQAKGASQEERVKASAKIVASFLRSWSGESSCSFYC